jgi:hypothetical protein
MPATKTANRTRRLFVWLDQVKADPELSPVAFMVAYEIGQHFDHRHGGTAWPSSLTPASYRQQPKPEDLEPVSYYTRQRLLEGRHDDDPAN